jgi:hypothetical protein
LKVRYGEAFLEDFSDGADGATPPSDTAPKCGALMNPTLPLPWLLLAIAEFKLKLPKDSEVTEPITKPQ